MLEYFILVHPLLASEPEPSSWRPVPPSPGIQVSNDQALLEGAGFFSGAADAHCDRAVGPALPRKVKGRRGRRGPG
jgi:hypothetical protein